MELKAYDQLGDLEKAYYYHEKMMTGELEKDQAIKALSNSKLLNREYKSILSNMKKRKKMNENKNSQGEIVTEEDELISSSDDEFEITVSYKIPLRENLPSMKSERSFLEGEEHGDDPILKNNLDQKKSNCCSPLAWNDKLIMARLKVLQLQRTKEMKSLQKNKSLTMNMANDQIGKVEWKMDLKNQEYLQKILQKRGKATNMQKKYRISHLTPNRQILSYHEAESQFLKNKNYSSNTDFIPTLDTQNIKKVQQILLKYKAFLLETIPTISYILNIAPINPVMNSYVPKNRQEQYNTKQYYDQNDFKFKKMQEIQN